MRDSQSKDVMISQFSDDELKLEIRRRERGMPRPLSEEDMDFSQVISYALEYVRMKADGQNVANCEVHLFGEVMESIFGKSFWKWWDKPSY